MDDYRAQDHWTGEAILRTRDRAQAAGLPITSNAVGLVLTVAEAVPHHQLRGAIEENERLRAFIASKREVRFEARCKGLITPEEYVASLHQPGWRSPMDAMGEGR